ncbi:1-phosphofructokinase family hexose kinase [Candidatus Bipolaricaulota bacterium]|nr:1-phosphofructokinase family hexose kinase [Candidatus Bipolaricaulota bacterium]
MIVTVTLNPAVDKMYWVEALKICDTTQEEFLTRAIRSSTSAGGKGVNVSVLLSRLGMDNVAMGFVGGHTGHVVVRDLRDEGVTTNFVWTHGETRANVTLLQIGREHSPNLINEAGPNILPEEVDRLMRRYKRILGRATWIVLGGSLPPGVDPGIYGEMAQMAKDAGAKVILSAGGEALSRALEACPYIVKPDTREHLTLEGKGLTTVDAIIEAGRHVVACGAEIVIISHDVTGDIAITKDDVWEIEAKVSTSKFKNLVGADDVFLGGILFKLAQDAPLDESLRFGLAAGLASAESDEKICRDLAVIEEGMKSITVTRL